MDSTVRWSKVLKGIVIGRPNAQALNVSFYFKTEVRSVRQSPRVCDDDGIDAKCMIPDHGIFATGQPDVMDVLGY